MKLRMWMMAVLMIAMVAGCAKTDNKQEASANNDAGKTQLDASGLLPADKAQAAPEFVLYNIDGSQTRLADYRGKVVIIDFWDTWCPPCKRGIPEMVELQKEHGDDLVILGIAFGRDGEDAVKKFADEYKINYPILLMDEQGMVARKYGGVQSIPTMFMIDREGRVRGMHVGYTPKEVFDNQLAVLI